MGNDLEIEIRAGSSPGTWEVEVDSPAGTATGVMQLDATAILGRRRELAASVLASAVTSRSTFSTLEKPVRDVGHSLFEALFADRVYGRYTASLQQAGTRGEPLRVILRLRDPQLAGIPWEALFDSEAGEYLCQREPVVRYVEVAQPSAPLSATGPLRILGMVAAPNDLPTLDTAEERRRLDDALGELVDQGLVEMVWVEAGSWGALQQKLVAGPWHVLHVIAHGGVSERGGVLALEHEETQKSAPVSAGRFARLLHACRPVPRLVVLNSCSSGESAADDLLSSTAAALVHSGISAAVAMQFAVTDPAALAFSRGFYQALSSNIPVDEAVRLGRIAIDGTSEQTLEWVTPVIYLRTDDTRLFDLTSQAPPPKTQPEQEQISSEAAKYGLYVQALAAARKDRYDEAATLLDSLVTLDPSYRDAVELRDRVRRDQQLGLAYARARAAEDAGDWETARRGYRSILEVDPDHEDAQQRHDDAERRLTIVSLRDEMRVHDHDEDWEAVLAVGAELARLDPDAADPDGMVTRAREMLAARTARLEPQEQEQAPEREQEHEHEPPEPPERPRTRAQHEGDDGDGGLPLVRTADPGEVPDDGPDDKLGGEKPGGTGIITHDEDRHPWSPWKKVAAIGAPLVLLTGVGLYLLGSTDDNGGGGGGGGGGGQTVTCWNGSSAGAASDCPLPTGQDGLKTVFPSMDDSCQNVEPSVSDKAEIFECRNDRYTVRYSRWNDPEAMMSYLNSHIKNAQTGEWDPFGTGSSIGRTWQGLDPNTSEERRFRGIAAYNDWPYDVTVKGVDQAALEEGSQNVQVKAPDQIGLP